MSTFSLADLFSPLAQVPQRFAPRLSSRPPLQRPSLSALAGQDQARLPRFVRESAVATRYLNLLGTLDWGNFPERAGHRFWPDVTPLSLSALAAAYHRQSQYLDLCADQPARPPAHPPTQGHAFRQN